MLESLDKAFNIGPGGTAPLMEVAEAGTFFEHLKHRVDFLYQIIVYIKTNKQKISAEKIENFVKPSNMKILFKKN